MNIEEIALKIEMLERQNLSKSAEITNYTQSALTSKVKKWSQKSDSLFLNVHPKD